MRNNSIGFSGFKVSSKMHLFVIISSVIIALGLAVGLICQFVANGFFNYGEDYANYKSVTVSYEKIDFSNGSGKEPVELIEEICDKAFKDEGISGYIVTYGEKSAGGEILYKFTKSTDSEKIKSAVSAIDSAISETASEGVRFSYASAHDAETFLTGGKAISMTAIAVASAIAFHFIYFAIRYKFTMALGAILADVHNLALYIALVALCRIPAGSAVATFGALTVLLTVIGTCFLFDRARKNLKSEEGKKLTSFELADQSARESLLINTVLPACLAGLAVVLFVLMSISSLSPLAIISPVLCAIVCVLASAYGTALFTPAVYARFKELSDKYKSSAKAKISK